MRVGRYEIVRELGRGGMARVHLARQLDLDRYAALKELGSLHREDAEMAARFVRESRLAGALNHPSIVTVLDFFEHDGTPYIAMEYVPRGSLRPWVGQLTVSQVGGVLESVLAGLAHAHAGSVVHRDLKPENLMVTDDGHVKITDFGIAKALIDSGTVAFRTATGAAIGTPAYMSPEQAMGEGVGPWTDLYATGVIAYELLSGSVPFGNREPMAILLAHCQEPPVPLAERAPDVPAPIAGWVDALLAKTPADRPPSATAAWEELEEHLLECDGPRWRRSARLEGEPGTDRPTGRPITPAQFPSDGRQTYETPATAEAAQHPPTPPEPAGAAATPTATPPPGEAESTAPLARPPRSATPTPRRRRGLLLGAGLAALAVIGVTLALTLPGDPETPTAPASTDDAGTDGPVPLGEDWMRAVHVVSYEPEGLTKPGFIDAVRRSKADGATHVVLRPMLVTDSVESSEFEDKADAPTDATLAAGIDAAEAEGVQSIIQPSLEPEGAYAGAYEPSDPDAFFAAYQERLGTWADIAGEHGADAIVVGTMFSLLDGPDYTDRWTALLNHARERCQCLVTYSAEDVEGAERIQFWGAADAIGVIHLAALTDEPTTDVDTLTRAWDPVKQRFRSSTSAGRSPSSSAISATRRWRTRRPRPSPKPPASRPKRRRPRSTRPPSARSAATTGSGASPGPSSTVTASNPNRTTSRSPASRRKRSCAPGRPPSRRQIAARIAAASSGRQITRSGRYGCAALYSSGAPLIRDACRP